MTELQGYFVVAMITLIFVQVVFATRHLRDIREHLMGRKNP